MAVINGVKSLHGADVYATDLRGGAALVIAGLAAEGNSIVRSIRHIDRGYAEFEKRLQQLGADIKRVKDEEIREEKEPAVQKETESL